MYHIFEFFFSTVPVFEIIRPLSLKICLLLDNSASIGREGLVDKVHNTAKKWIINDFPNGSWISIVKFS